MKLSDVTGVSSWNFWSALSLIVQTLLSSDSMDSAIDSSGAAVSAL